MDEVELLDKIQKNFQEECISDNKDINVFIHTRAELEQLMLLHLRYNYITQVQFDRFIEMYNL